LCFTFFYVFIKACSWSFFVINHIYIINMVYIMWKVKIMHSFYILNIHWNVFFSLSLLHMFVVYHHFPIFINNLLYNNLSFFLLLFQNKCQIAKLNYILVSGHPCLWMLCHVWLACQ
jgi:hypothetical protein